MSTLTEKLKTLGLTENECTVYFAFLKLGAGTVAQLSREAAARLERVSTEARQTAQEEVPVIYGPQSARAMHR